MNDGGAETGLTVWQRVFVAALALFFALFLFYPLLYVIRGAFIIDGRFSLAFFALMARDPIIRRCVWNSTAMAAVTTVLCGLMALPLAYLFSRLRFAGRNLLQNLLLAPLIMPPFVGAIGVRQILGRYGSLNELLVALHIISPHHRIDWLLGGFWCVVALQTLHLYPILYLNVMAAIANIDPSLEEAAENLGATRWRIFRTVVLPLTLPGFFAGAIIVFVWAFTDLGTPLMFGFRQVIAVQIFDRVKAIHQDPMGYALVVLVLLLTAIFFYISRRHLDAGQYQMMGRGHVAPRERVARAWETPLAWAVVAGIIALALLPHVSVVLTALSQAWAMTILPQKWTTIHFSEVFRNDLTAASIRNSLVYSVASTVVDVILGFGIAYLLARKQFRGKALLDITAMLPLALPGIILAFGYVACFSGTPLDARVNPTWLLIISYAVRRLPFAVRSAHAGLQQTSVTFEEAAQNLGAPPLMTLRTVTLPLIAANLIAGGILCFSFAMLEVSDSLILSMTMQYHPITKAIYVLSNLPEGPYVASAMGVLGMVLLMATLLLAGKLLGKKMGEIFRV